MLNQELEELEELEQQVLVLVLMHLRMLWSKAALLPSPSTELYHMSTEQLDPLQLSPTQAPRVSQAPLGWSPHSLSPHLVTP